MKTEEEIKKVLIQALYEREDYSDYDYEDNFIADDGYIGWRDAIDFVADKLGIKISQDDIWEYACSEESTN